MQNQSDAGLLPTGKSETSHCLSSRFWQEPAILRIPLPVETLISASFTSFTQPLCLCPFMLFFTGCRAHPNLVWPHFNSLWHLQRPYFHVNMVTLSDSGWAAVWRKHDSTFYYDSFQVYKKKKKLLTQLFPKISWRKIKLFFLIS